LRAALGGARCLWQCSSAAGEVGRGHCSLHTVASETWS